MGRRTGIDYNNFFLEKESYKIKIERKSKSDSRLQRILNYLVNVSEDIDSTEKGNPFFKIGQSRVELDREEGIIYLRKDLQKEVRDRLYKLASESSK